MGVHLFFQQDTVCPQVFVHSVDASQKTKQRIHAMIQRQIASLFFNGYIVLFYAVAYLFYLTSSLSAVDLTLVNEQPVVRTGVISYFKCVSDSPNLPYDVFTRVMDTGSGAYLTSMAHSGPISPESWPGKRLALFPEGGLKRTGVFSCNIGSNGNDQTAIGIKIGASGNVWPDEFTVTASLSEDINLAFRSHSGGRVVWRHNGIIMSSLQTLNHRISYVKQSDAGIYECYQITRREHLEDSYRPIDQGIMRLIVRNCPPMKWSPPNCGRSCRCINGGACDDATGQCVCPPGFKGERCEEACGGNRFGSSCQHSCKPGGSTHGADAEECKSRQFCLLDPYGCSCATGFQGMECTDGCSVGTYGANCRQECHCKRPELCNRFTGACTMGCGAGWKGQSCQEECDPGNFGEGCNMECNCNGGAVCDRFTGECPRGECEYPFTGRSCQTDRIDECDSNPCQYGGSCTDHVLDYSCSCVNGTSGKSCEIDVDECESNPCQHNSTCQDNGIMSFSCECVPGYTGVTCESDIDDCVDHSCVNGATCVDEVDAYKCACESGYIGTYCEEICSVGTYYVKETESCEVCAPTSYQSKSGQAFCIPCPLGTASKRNGSISADECEVKANTSNNGAVFIIVGLMVAVALAAASGLIWYYGFHRKKNRLERVTIRHAW